MRPVSLLALFAAVFLSLTPGAPGAGPGPADHTALLTSSALLHLGQELLHRVQTEGVRHPLRLFPHEAALTTQKYLSLGPGNVLPAASKPLVQALLDLYVFW